MKKLRWQILIVFVSLVVIFLLLRGQKPTLQEVVPIQPVKGGVYTEALIGSFGRLNPLLNSYNQVDQDVNKLLFSGLIRFDTNGIPIGDLAESWGISQDGTVYNFSLRPEAVWHNDNPVTSQDVIFTINLLRNEEFPAPADIREFWNNVDVKELDERAIQFRLEEPLAPFLDYLTFGILPKSILGQIPEDEIVDAQFNYNPVGSGPYKFDRLITEDGQISGLVLTAFEDYFSDRPFIDEVVFYYFGDAASAFEAYNEGKVLGINLVTPDVLSEVLKVPQLNIYTGRLPRLNLIFLNLDNPETPFFQDVSVRKSLLMGLNRQWYLDNLMNGQAIIADGPILPGTWAYFEGIERIEFDVDGSIASLKESGYTIPAEGGDVREKEGVRLTFELIHPSGERYSALAEAIKKDWAEIGVEVETKSIEYGDLVENYLETRDYEAALVNLNLMDSPDPDPYPFWHQSQVIGGQNFANWNDRQASEYLESARITDDLLERTKAYNNFQVRFMSEMPALPLFYPVYSYAIDNIVQGVRVGTVFDPSERFNHISTWYLKAERSAELESEQTETP